MNAFALISLSYFYATNVHRFRFFLPKHRLKKPKTLENSLISLSYSFIPKTRRFTFFLANHHLKSLRPFTTNIISSYYVYGPFQPRFKIFRPNLFGKEIKVFIQAFLRGDFHEKFEKLPHHTSTSLNAQYFCFLLKEMFDTKARQIHNDMIFHHDCQELLNYVYWGKYEPGKHSSVPPHTEAIIVSLSPTYQDNDDQPFAKHA